ncbi:MAG: type 1 glutamine amidotransferase [Flavobacterium sp.]|nr:MAG: type 1 glutamine amidotransferase [Flavobacterium sp.]
MRVHYLQHVSFEGLGSIEGWMIEKNHILSKTSFFKTDYTLPRLEDIDALIVLGGPMSVHDVTQFPWLEEEKAFIKSCVLKGKRVLGICLGAQLLASLLGAKVGKAKHKEIGWFPLEPTEESKNIPWFYRLFADHPTVFHWHGEKFEIPQGCLNMLSSEANENQAFYLNKNVIGLQFHLEATAETIALMLQNGQEEMMESPFIQTERQIIKDSAGLNKGNIIMDTLLRNWIS